MKRAGFWLRLSATTIDIALVLILLSIITVAVQYTAPIVLGIDVAYHEGAMGMIQLLLVLGYSLSEVMFAATPGKLHLRMRITCASGDPADIWRLVLRWSTKWSAIILNLCFLLTVFPLFYYLSGFMNFVILLGCLPILGEDKRAWHDEWSGTAVCRRARKPVAIAA